MKNRFQYEVIFTPKRDVFREVGIAVASFCTGVASTAGLLLYLAEKDRKHTNEIINDYENKEVINEEEES